MYFLDAINSDRQTRLLNVLRQIAMILGDKKNYSPAVISRCILFAQNYVHDEKLFLRI